MKQSTLLFSIAIFPVLLFAQKKDEINFSDPFQIDSSEYFLIPELVDNDNQDLYGKGTGYLPWGDYMGVYFYNSKTKQSKRLFAGQLALIQSFAPRRSYYDKEPASVLPVNILPDHIVYLARIDNFNNDKALDTHDPVYLFLSDKTGANLKQITPKGFHVISWTLSNDKKLMLVKMKNDKNNNRKFGIGDDELYYRIDLDKDISKIQGYQISL